MKAMILINGLTVMALVSGAAMADGEAYLGLGTTGYTVGYTYPLSETSGIRAEYNGMDYSHNVSSASETYNAKIKLSNLGAYYDYHIAGGFRATVGLVETNSKFTGTATASSGTYTINGTSYSAAGETLGFEAKMPSTMPYFGLGYGHVASNSGWGFYGDIGFLYGKPKSQLNASSGLVAAAGQTNIDAENQKLQDQLNKFEFYPVLQVGASYTF